MQFNIRGDNWKEVIAAADGRRYEALGGYFSPEARIHITMGEKDFNYTTAEYLETLKMAQDEIFTTTRKTEVVDLQVKDNRAMVVLKVSESATTASFGTLTVQSDQAAILEKQEPGGKLRIVSWTVSANYNQNF